MFFFFAGWAKRTLTNCIREDLIHQNYRHSNDEVFELQVDKVLQLYETMLTRHTCMVVGPTQVKKKTIKELLKFNHGGIFKAVATKIHFFCKKLMT